MPSLLLGCGHNHSKQILLKPDDDWVQPLVKVDMNPNCGADILHDLSLTQHGIQLPFPANHFDEIGAFHVLEHWGAQGDWKAYFNEFAEYWRILKPGGLMFILVPIGDLAFCDIGHTRFFSPNHFGFLWKKYHDDQRAAGTNATDYRWYWKHDFEPLMIHDMDGKQLAVVLKKVVHASQD
jgi:SAM-dependent methyltransferase